MASKARKLVKEQRAFVSEQAQVLREAPGTLARRVAAKTARTVKSLEHPARVATRTGVRLTALSQHTLESLLELQLEIVTSVITNAAAQLERMARARSVRGVVTGQAGELRAARDRIAADLERVIAILKRAGRGVRTAASEAYTDVVSPPAEVPVPVRRRKAKRTVRKSKRATKR